MWLVVTSVFFLLPTNFDENGHQTVEGFNYTCVVVGGVSIVAMIYWFLPAPHGARHFFVGPKRDLVEHSEIHGGEIGKGEDASEALLHQQFEGGSREKHANGKGGFEFSQPKKRDSEIELE